MKEHYKQTSIFGDAEQEQGEIECLGRRFANEEARRTYFLDILREKLKDPAFRQIEGFPLGEDEDILALSDPPYYTACPNPFIEEFVRYYGKPYDPEVAYSREPFAADVSEGKNDPIYNAHSYHTKVPHKAIMRYILHYTEPGDVVFDGFCGTGMTGVAAQMCGNRKAIEELGYTIRSDNTILDEQGHPFSKLGGRYSALNDLSPAATFIAYNYNTPIDVARFEREANSILERTKQECGWMYLTLHQPQDMQIEEALSQLQSGSWEASTLEANMPWGYINFTVWSDVFVCSECTGEVVFWESAVSFQQERVLDEFSCPHCQANLSKRSMKRAWVNKYDKYLKNVIKQSKQVLVLINYSVAKKRFEKKPDAFDFALVEYIEDIDIPHYFPTDRMVDGEESRRNDDTGITHVHHFYTKRNLFVLSKISYLLQYTDLKFRFWFTSALTWVGKENRLHLGNYFGKGGGVITSLRGTWYIASLSVETSVFERFTLRKRSQGFRAGLVGGNTVVETSSASVISIPANSCDYIFTDPPFGGNLMYSELNFLWEAWLRVFTNNELEAIENKVQGKGLLEYQALMARSFQAYYEKLKPGRWITVEFHNSKNSVWNAIQEALQLAGFVIADVRTLDKGKGTFKQVTSAASVKQDLIISAYKPNGGLEERFRLEAGTDEGCWDFVKTHLRQLPVFVSKGSKVEVVAERMPYLLFDRMVAFHVQHGVGVPLSAAEFYSGLAQRFSERDSMYFLSEQVAEYDKKRITINEIQQLQLIVTDEVSAIQWLRQQLAKKPQTFQEIHPLYMRELGGWFKHEKMLELAELLEQSFLRYEGTGEVPSQIHSYLSSNYKELRNLAKDDPALQEKAKGRWYIPDPNKAIDLEKLREKGLLKEFEEYKASSGRKRKQFRLEAVRAGFKKAWQERNYPLIIEIAQKIPENILQEDSKLVMWYEQAITRTENAQ